MKHRLPMFFSFGYILKGQQRHQTEPCMNGHPESRERHAPQPATAIASHRVRPDKVAEYLEGQTAITDAARRFDGFIGTEVLGPVAGLQEEWVAIFRLESNQAMKRWLASPERLDIAARIENFLIEPSRMLVLASDDGSEPPVAMVFAHRLAKGKVADYLAWRRKAIAAQAHHPGYIATEFFEPHGKLQDEWVDIVRYDSLANLTKWMESKERQVLVKELESIVESMHAHRLTGLEGWFGLNRGSGATASGPPSWKQAAAVLFALYPTVMVLTYLNPFMRNLSLPVQMLISNLLSVSLLTFLVMPTVTRFLSFWLAAPTGDWKREALGLGTVALGLGMFVAIFRML
jgi:antibiotic biosynthesis monooxygenase (ABM) superfamily enzyme